MKTLIVISLLISSLTAFANQSLNDDLTQAEAKAIYEAQLEKLPPKAAKKLEKVTAREQEKSQDIIDEKYPNKHPFQKNLHCLGIDISLIAEYDGMICHDLAPGGEFYFINTFGVGWTFGGEFKYGYLKYRGDIEEIEGRYKGFNAGLSFYLGGGYSRYTDKDEYQRSKKVKIINIFYGSIGAASILNLSKRWVRVSKPIQ